MSELRVRRDDLALCEIADGESEADELGDGRARLLVERFALTANNVTYALLGDQLGYWQLFPAPPGWGRIPAWGYARVVGSRSTALEEGQRVFGVVPMATYLSVLPAAHPIGFVDAAQHRSELSPVYNQYLSVDEDADEAALVMRPLFGTALLLDQVLSDGDWGGGRTLVLTSASSKTAYSLAHLARKRGLRTVGLTSPTRRAWVESLELYDAVLDYDDATRLSAPDGAVLVDFASDRAVVRRLHEHLGDSLRRSILVGFTRWQAGTDQAPVAGPAPEFFFAPTEMERRGRELGQRYAAAWPEFASVVERAMRIERVTGGDELVRVYHELLEGRVDPAVGYVASLS